MRRTKNVGGFDRVARGILGIGLVVVALSGFTAGRRLTAIVAGLGAAGLLFNAATQFCGLNALLGIDTCSHE
jgi:threonine dehydrogenase-like Zn-dependent dehydrogenase